jgi:hypothetical protein
MALDIGMNGENVLDMHKEVHDAITTDSVNHEFEKCQAPTRAPDIVNYSCLDIDSINKNLTPNKDSQGNTDISFQLDYLQKIYEKADKILYVIEHENNLNMIDGGVFENTIKRQTDMIKDRIKVLTVINVIFGIIVAILIYNVFKMYIVEYFKLQRSGARPDFREYISSGVAIGVILIYIEYVIVYNNIISSRKNLEDRIRNLQNIKENDMADLNRILKSVKSIIKYILCDIHAAEVDNVQEGTEVKSKEERLNERRVQLSNNLYNFLTKYNKLTAVSVRNKLQKSERVKEINTLFNAFSGILYRHDNRFTDIVVDTSKPIECLLNMILLHKECDNSETFKCQLNSSCGMLGLVETQHVDSFSNGIAGITKADVSDFFNKLTQDVMNSASRYQLNKMKLYKVISNIFINKIYYYQIKKDDFLVKIYKHFEKINLSENPKIKISQFDLINNYKHLINMFYHDYDIYYKIDNATSNRKESNIAVSRSKFSEIMKAHNNNQILDLNQQLMDKIEEIGQFKKMFKNDIKDELNSDRKSNRNYGYMALGFSIISLFQIIGFWQAIPSGSSPKEFFRRNVRMVTILSVVIFLNSIVASYWYKKTIRTDYQEMVIDNNNLIFEKELQSMVGSLSNINTAKKLNDYTNNEKEVTLLLEQLNINRQDVNTDDDSSGNRVVYSQHTEGTNYVILDENDIQNIVHTEFYYKLIKSMKLYECCSFLSGHKKIAVFPWTELSINVSLLLITLGIMAFIMTDNNLRPTLLLDKISSKFRASKSNVSNNSARNTLYGSQVGRGKGGMKGGNNLQTQVSRVRNLSQGPTPSHLSPTTNTLNNTKAKALTYVTQMDTGDKSAILMYLVGIYLSLYYTYKIYTSTFQFQENLFR